MAGHCRMPAHFLCLLILRCPASICSTPVIPVHRSAAGCLRASTTRLACGLTCGPLPTLCRLGRPCACRWGRYAACLPYHARRHGLLCQSPHPDEQAGTGACGQAPDGYAGESSDLVRVLPWALGPSLWVPWLPFALCWTTLLFSQRKKQHDALQLQMSASLPQSCRAMSQHG